MFVTKTGSNKSKTIEALIPMIDLFAVLAIVFMIYSSDEIIAEQEKSQRTIEEIATEYKKLQQELAAAEEARQRRREILAQNAVKSLEEIEVEREQKAKELVQQFTQMMEQQQEQAKIEYETLLAKLELEQEKEVERQKAELEQESQQKVEVQIAKLEEQKEIEISSAKQVFEQQMTAQQEQLETTTQAIIAAELERVKDLNQQQAQMQQQQQVQVAMMQQQQRQQQLQQSQQAQQQQAEALAQQKAELEAQKQAAAQAAAEAAAEAARQQAAAQAEQQLQQELAAQQAKLAAQQAEELAQQQAQLEAQKAQELAEQQARAEREAQELARKAAEAAEQEVRKTAKQDALAEVEAEKERQAAQKVREQIVDNLLENFKDDDGGDVNIDQKTGKVRINFQESYFVRGSAELSDSMKDLLRVMIPKYAKSIYEVENAAKQVESLKISGLTSPIFRAKYFDINDTSPEGEEAREYNLKLSNDRAMAMYNFIFDENEMGDYEFRADLKADLGIAALGYRTAAPVPEHLVGQPAICIEYDCQREQASILEFRLYSEQ